MYRPREHRSFRNTATYQEGRVLGDARTTRAVKNKSKFGRAVEFQGWLHHEFAVLGILHAAGADVPRPIAMGPSAMLLEFIDEDGTPAPQLSRMRLSSAMAEALLEQALRNIEVMLACHVVHGDLSAYNMLYAGGTLRVIDLPQALDARSNVNASTLLARDIANVCDYFASQGADERGRVRVRLASIQTEKFTKSTRWLSAAECWSAMACPFRSFVTRWAPHRGGCAQVSSRSSHEHSESRCGRNAIEQLSAGSVTTYKERGRWCTLFL
jgi:serine/threonine-protein kinase RIO1